MRAGACCIYEHQEGRGIGLLNKLRAYELQDQGSDTVEANQQLGFDVDLRHYELPGSILRYFGLKNIRLISNNPEKVQAVESAGVLVAERVPCIVAPLDYSKSYLTPRRTSSATCSKASEVRSINAASSPTPVPEFRVNVHDISSRRTRATGKISPVLISLIFPAVKNTSNRDSRAEP